MRSCYLRTGLTVFISFSFVINLSSSSSIVLIDVVRMNILVFYPDCTEKLFNFLPLSTILAVDFSYMAFTMLSYFSSLLSLLPILVCCLSLKCLNIIKCVSACMKTIIYFLYSVNVVLDLVCKDFFCGFLQIFIRDIELKCYLFSLRFLSFFSFFSFMVWIWHQSNFGSIQ